MTRGILGPVLDHMVIEAIERKHRDAHARTWYLATCQNCTPELPQPFRDEAERDAWANAHREGTGHEVLNTTQEGT